MVWNAELAVAAVNGSPHPEFVGFDEGKYLLVSDRVLVPDDQELLPVFHELGDVLAEKGKGRIGDDDVRLFQKLDALGTTEVTSAVQGHPSRLVALEEELYVVDVRCAVAVLVLHMVERHSQRFGFLAFVVALKVLWEERPLPGDR